MTTGGGSAPEGDAAAALATVRTTELDAVLHAIIGGQEPPQMDATDPWSLGLAAFATGWRLDHDRTAALADLGFARLPARWGDDPEATVLVCAVRALASAGLGVPRGWCEVSPGTTPTGDPIADAVELLDRLGQGRAAGFARYALAEAALACARVDLAVRIVAGGGEDAAPSAPPHPYDAVEQVLRARVAAFNGRIADAEAVLASVERSGVARIDRLVDATRVLVDGNAAKSGLVHSLAAQLQEPVATAPSDRIDLGASLLIAFGLIAIGEVRRSAGIALAVITAGPPPMLVDRVLALELALAAALLDHDLDAAQSWAAAAEPFADDAIADSTVARMRCRVALLAGDPTAAIAFADAAVDRARANGRVIELAEGEILAARARIAAGRPGEAGRRLSEAVAVGERDGHRSVRRSATAELRMVGRRLPPARGSGDDALSAREREVRDLLLAGHGNADIAARLHLSPHTVRVHVSRVLAAHGVPTRFALVADAAARSVGEAGLVLDAERLGELTARQREVLEQLVGGASNAEIAGRLGIAVRTVEKHLGGVMQRWGAGGRAEIVAIAVGASHVDPAVGRTTSPPE